MNTRNKKNYQTFLQGLVTNCLLLILSGLLLAVENLSAQESGPILHYKVSITQPVDHIYEVILECSSVKKDSIVLKMPKWMPGYYQLMNYDQSVDNFKATIGKNHSINWKKVNENSWLLTGIKNKKFTVSYRIKTTKQFVANSYVDSEHAYLIPANSFLYIDGQLNLPVKISLSYPREWTKVATGLEPFGNAGNQFIASDFDILYDCPILIGQLEELKPFLIKGKKHRFIGYKMGFFDKEAFIKKLEKIVEASVAIIGDIPYKEYTFIGIGPGRGGIEHLNNTTISFDGSGLDKPGALNGMLNFLAHEYFHHYNVKRIKPVELGPFDYDKGSRTNLLWISEGLTVYYEYLVVKRAGLSDEETLFKNFSGNITRLQNNPGRQFQSLQQASYRTWADGPFGTQGSDVGKTISYYEKGPLVGLLLDFEIRNATQNRSSLDDVMRSLYNKFYLSLKRGFTEAEFQEVCEQVAGKTLTDLFEYVYTTKELEYNKYLGHAGLELDGDTSVSGKSVLIRRIQNPSPLQEKILKSWLGN